MKFYINLFWVSFKNIHFFLLAGFHLMGMFAVILDVSEVSTQDSSRQKMADSNMDDEKTKK